MLIDIEFLKFYLNMIEDNLEDLGVTGIIRE